MGLDRPPVSASTFWEELYADGKDGWELGMPAPPLAAWLEAGGRFTASDAAGPARVAVPGAGRGHDARLLARVGCRVRGFDFAPAAIAEARTLAAREGVEVEYEQRDIFTLDRDHAGFFDGVWEYTCYCAIDPRRRREYVDVLRAIVRPGGWLLGCFFPLRAQTAGPPFQVSMSEIRRLFAPAFRLERAFPPLRSTRARQGREWMVLARRQR